MNFKSMPAQDNPRIKIVFATSDEYFAVTGALRDIFVKDSGWPAKFASDLLAKIETDYDAEDSGEGGKPSVILEDSVVEQALPLLFVSASKLTTGVSEGEIKQLKTTVGTLTTKLGQYEEKAKAYDTLMQKSSALTRDKDKADQDKAALQKQVDDLSSQAASLQHLCKSLKDDAESKAKERQSLYSSLQKAQENLEAAEKAKENLANSLQQTQEKLDAAEKAKENLSSTLQKTQAELEAERKAKEELNNTLAETQRAAQGKVTPTENHDIQVLTNQIKTLEDSLAAERAREKAMQTRISAMGDQIVSLTSQKQTETKTELQANVQAGMDQIKRLQEQLQKAEDDRDDARKAMEDAESKHHAEMEAKDAEVSRYIVADRDLRAEVDRLQAQARNYDGVYTLIASYKRQIADMQAWIGKLQAKAEGAEKQVAAKDEELAKEKQKSAELNSNVEILKLTVSDLTNEIKVSQKKKKRGFFGGGRQ